MYVQTIKYINRTITVTNYLHPIREKNITFKINNMCGTYIDIMMHHNNHSCTKNDNDVVITLRHCYTQLITATGILLMYSCKKQTIWYVEEFLLRRTFI